MTAPERSYPEVLKAYPPLTKRELREQVIEFANTGSPHAYVLLRIGVRLDGLALAAAVKALGTRGQQERAQEQAAAKDALTRIVAMEGGARWGPLTSRPRMTGAIRDRWAKHAEGLALVPTIGRGDRFGEPLTAVPLRPVIRKRFPRPPMAPIAYVLLELLLDSSELCSCKQCGTLFLAMRPAEDRKGGKRGRDVRLYCKPEHRIEAEKEQARERSRRYREKPKSKPTRRRR